jgi:hypothetical protein
MIQDLATVEFLGWPQGIVVKNAALVSTWTEKQYNRVADELYNTYQQAVLSGNYRRWDKTKSADSMRITSHVAKTTGVPWSEVWNFLSQLERLAKAGQIDIKHWSPRTMKTVTRAVQKQRKEDIAAAIDPVIDPLWDKVKAPLLVTGVLATVGVVGYFSVNKYMVAKAAGRA